MERSRAPSVTSSTSSTLVKVVENSMTLIKRKERSTSGGRVQKMVRMRETGIRLDPEETDMDQNMIAMENSMIQMEDLDFSLLATDTPPIVDLLSFGHHKQRQHPLSHSGKMAASSSQMDGLMPTGVPSQALRSVPKRSGLFDQECSDDFLKDLKHLVSSERPDDFILDSYQYLEENQCGHVISDDLFSPVANLAGGSNLDLLSGNTSFHQSDFNTLFGDLVDVESITSPTSEELMLLSIGGGEGEKLTEAVDLPSLPNSPLGLAGGMDLEQFTDLTQLTNAIIGPDAAKYMNIDEEIEASQEHSTVDLTQLTAVPFEEQHVTDDNQYVTLEPYHLATTTTPEVPSETVEKPTEAKKKSHRRKRKIAATENNESDATTTKKNIPFIAVNPDHNDYTLKVKSVKVSTTSRASSDSEENEMCSDTESVTSSTSYHPKKADKNAQRRIKNNVASRRSRASRKQKFIDLEDRAIQLEKDNQVMKEKIEIMEELAKSLKQHLVAQMSGRK